MDERDGVDSFHGTETSDCNKVLFTEMRLNCVSHESREREEFIQKWKRETESKVFKSSLADITVKLYTNNESHLHCIVSYLASENTYFVEPFF